MKLLAIAIVLKLHVSSSLATISSKDWKSLNASVGGRLFQHAPFARSCFKLSETTVGSFDAAQCATVQSNYLNTLNRVDDPGSYEGTQWEGCPATGQACLLDSTNPLNPVAFAPPKVCHQGSVSSYFIEVQQASDVQAAFKFVRKTGVELVIKNTGHDYHGTSARPGSLALWTRKLSSMSFNPSWRPDGCSAKTPTKQVGILGAGVDLLELYQFGDANNLTFPGGACATVSPSGGYVLGGGHSAISNIEGLGVDRALQFKVVIPNGQILVANACQNTDLFFALRGGGGGTFGVVLEVVSLALPRTPIQSFVVNNIPADEVNNRKFWKIITDHTSDWVKAGWGGYATSTFAQYVNPVQSVTTKDVQAQMAALHDFATSVNATISQGQMPSFFAWWTEFLLPVWQLSGSPNVVASRLIPAANFATQQSRDTLLDAMLAAGKGHQITGLFSIAPFNFKPDGLTSVTPAWRNSFWEFVLYDEYNYNVSISSQKTALNNMQTSLEIIRKITPDSGAYMNEAFLHEPNFEQAFWGENFERLLQIKKKYDPEHILDCWHCVGWKGRSNANYKCYL